MHKCPKQNEKTKTQKSKTTLTRREIKTPIKKRDQLPPKRFWKGNHTKEEKQALDLRKISDKMHGVLIKTRQINVYLFMLYSKLIKHK